MKKSQLSTKEVVGFSSGGGGQGHGDVKKIILGNKARKCCSRLKSWMEKDGEGAGQRGGKKNETNSKDSSLLL